DVYRDGVRVKDRVAASPYTDAPGDSVSHAYHVVAVSADCQLEDGNGVSKSAADAIGDPGPTFAGIVSAGHPDQRAAPGGQRTWDPATFGPSGGTYKIWRDGVLIKTGVTASPYVDVPGDSVSHSYRVTAISNDCAREDSNNATRSAADAVGDPVPTFAGIVSA